MQFIWAKNKNKYGYKTIFRYVLNDKADKLILCAGPYYTVFFDNQLVSYGPERTASGYTRKREIIIPYGIKNIEIIVLDYGYHSLDIDDGQPFFGAEIYNQNQLVASSKDFKVYDSSKFVNRTFKYSYQRGFGERFDLRNIKEIELKTYEISPLKIIDGVGDLCKYHEMDFSFLKVFPFGGFDSIRPRDYMYKEEHPEFHAYHVENEFIEATKNGYLCFEYGLKEEKSGLIKLRINSQEDDVKLFITFTEYLENGEWMFGRSSATDLITVDVNKGEYEITTSTVYSLKYLRILTNKEIQIKPSLILIQNDNVPELPKSGDEKKDVIMAAARNTFMQNALDIYTDCPGRERGGWLCDSYFTSKAETFFTGKNDIERCFLENFIIGEYPEIEKGMLPMAFPGHDTTFIPNWAMWFVLELEQYYKKTNDLSLVESAKDKVYGLVKYFEQFENEYGLLENLRSWVFVEWSAAGTEDFVEGVSFPTNMLYGQMLKSVSSLYHDEKLLEKGEKVLQNTNKLSFNGKLYIDNAIRINGILTPIKKHTSETCQYYALFFKLNQDQEFINFVKDELGPQRKSEYPSIPESNSFIGFYLRFFWLKEIGAKDILKQEIVNYFYNMAKYSGTLWEKNIPSTSCNHAFASSIAEILFDL